MSMFTLIILFVIGLCVGSFLNVVIFRYDPELSFFSLERWRGRSKCPKCEKILKWYELVPVFSFVFQRGRCLDCGERISWQYPVVEIASGLIMAGVPWFLYNFYNLSADISASFYGLMVLWVLVFLAWLVITFIDRIHFVIPNELNLVLVGLGVGVTYLEALISNGLLPSQGSFLGKYALVVPGVESIWGNHILGLLVGGLFLVIVIVLSRGRAMGWGDVKLGAVSGLMLGWPDIGLALALAFIIGGAWGVILIGRQVKKMKDKIPFGPFLVLGGTLTFFLGEQILNWYFALFGI